MSWLEHLQALARWLAQVWPGLLAGASHPSAEPDGGIERDGSDAGESDEREWDEIRLAILSAHFHF